MKSIQEKLKVHFYLLRNSPKIIGILLAAFALHIIFTIYLLTLGMGGYLAFSFLTKTNFIFSTCLMLCSFPIFKLVQSTNQEELVESLSHNKNVFSIYTYINILLGVAIYNVILFIFLYFQISGMSLINFISEFTINMFLPQVICLSFSFILSLFKNTALSIIQMIIFVFFTSSWSESIIWESKPSFPIDKIYGFLKRPFEIFYQNNEWGVDVQYGLQNELGRKSLLLFWLLLLVGIFIIYVYKKKTKKRNNFRLSIVIINLGVVACLIGGYLPESRFRINNKWDGYFKDFFDYDREGIRKEEKINYGISDYNLDIKIDRFLKVKGKLQLQSQSLQQDFDLTLYKNYKVKSLTSSKAMTYVQKDDYIHIKFEEPIQNIELEIEYSGYHPRFYSNQSAVLLPGYFPWYPMSGQKQIYINSGDIMQNVLNGYNSYLHINEANITLHTDREYITNLDKSAKNKYSSKSDSISLFSGYIEETGDKQIMSYLPINSDKDLQLSNIKDSLNHSLEILNQQFGISKDVFDSKKLFYVTSDIHRNNSLGIISVFKDYAIITNMLNPSDLFLYLTNKSAKYTPLTTMMKSMGIYETEEETYRSIFEELKSTELKDKVEEVIKKVGIKNFLHDTYLYTLDESNQDDMKFLEGMIDDD